MSEVLIEVTDRKGQVRQLSGPVGSTLMVLLKARGMPVAGTCSGAKVCSTCHVYIAEGYSRVGAPDEDELDLLSESEHCRGNSRLGCQITLEEGLAGLQVELAPQD